MPAGGEPRSLGADAAVRERRKLSPRPLGAARCRSISAIELDLGRPLELGLARGSGAVGDVRSAGARVFDRAEVALIGARSPPEPRRPHPRRILGGPIPARHSSDATDDAHLHATGPCRMAVRRAASESPAEARKLDVLRAAAFVWGWITLQRWSSVASLYAVCMHVCTCMPDACAHAPCRHNCAVGFCACGLACLGTDHRALVQ